MAETVAGKEEGKDERAVHVIAALAVRMDPDRSPAVPPGRQQTRILVPGERHSAASWGGWRVPTAAAVQR